MTTVNAGNPGVPPSKLRSYLRLTRWREYVPYVLPLTVMGAILATKAAETTLDWRLITTMLANGLAMAYAFMINDIVDAPDDAREADRASRNPISCGELKVGEAWFVSLLVGAASLILFGLAGTATLIIGGFMLALCHFYSWKPIRLKAWPIADVVSHSLMLSGLLFLTGYFAYHTEPGPVWFVALAMILISSYGQLYNQIRDYDMDVAAGLHNTSIVVGKHNAQLLSYAALVVAGLLLIYSLIIGVIPLWIVAVPIIASPVFLLVRPGGADARGTAAVNFTGNIQVQVMWLANITVGVWLVVTLLGGR